jgi:hypothetical protein
MTAATTKLITNLYGKNQIAYKFTLQDLSHYSGASFKQIDLWLKEGFVPAYQTEVRGSGHDRLFSYDASFMVAMLADIDRIGIGTQKIREITAAIHKEMADPIGLLIIDLMDPSNTKRVENNTPEVSVTIKNHLFYGTSSPLLIYDLDKLHIRLSDWYYDLQVRFEMNLANELFGYKTPPYESITLVTPIDDPEEYRKKNKKPSNSRFR